MLRYIQVSVNNQDQKMEYLEGIPSVQDATYTTETIEVLRYIQDDVHVLYNKFRCDRYDSPGTLVLGWKTWIQLSYAESGFTSPGARINEWRWIPIIVDDATPDWIQFLPKLKDVMMGGYEFVG